MVIAWQAPERQCVNVLLFAQLRELYGASHATVADDVFPCKVSDLRANLAEQKKGEFGDALLEPNVFCAVNQRVVDESHVIHVDDEVGLFPPMTGG
ncbi:MAG: MoaD/ThiS family protein [Pseudomonadota bacterium]